MKSFKPYLSLLAVIFVCTSLQSCKDNKHHTCPNSRVCMATDSILSSIFADNEPGAVALISRGDSVVFCQAYGMADLANGTPMSDSTLLNISSISKQFAAVAVLKLRDQGLLSLEDSLPKFFATFNRPVFEKVKLRHLLSHTSGIPDKRPRTQEEWREYERDHETHFGNVRDYMLYSVFNEGTAFMRNLDALAFEPGTAFDYNNPNYQLVRPLVETVTDQDFRSWMSNNIFTPAGMHRTEFFSPSNNSSYAHAYKLAEGPNTYKYYRSNDGKWEEFDYGEANFFSSKADTGIYTTVLDFFNWQKALFNGEIINAQSLEEALTPVIATDVPYTSYGLGFYIEHKPDKPLKIYHNGRNGGFLAAEAYFPDTDVSYMIFSNRSDWDRNAVCEKIDRILQANGWI